MFAEVWSGKQLGEFLTLAIAAAIVLVFKYGRTRWRPSGSAHGTATFASARDMKRWSMFSGAGLLLGRTLDRVARILHLPRYTHLAVFAPTGAGKGVSFLIPWLWTWNFGSCVVLDPKGELFEKTAARRREMSQRVVRLDPFGVCGKGADTFNPLDLIGTGPECIDDCRALAEAMVVRSGEEKDPHWNDRAANVLTGVLAYVCANFSGAERSFASMREILCTPGMLEGCAKELQKMGGVFAWLGGAMLPLEDKEKAGVLSTAHRHVQFLDSPAILPATASGLDARTIKSGKVTVYLILPPHQLEAQSRWLRLMIASKIRLVGREQMAKGKECLFLLDEAGQLGAMQPIEQGLTLLRAAGVRLALFYQSLGQLKDCWGEGKQAVLLDNTDHVFFGAREETAKKISERLGKYTESASSYSENSGTSYTTGGKGCEGTNYSSSSNTNVSVHSRALLTPDEVERLPPEIAIGFFRGLPPLLFARVLYYSDPFFRPYALLRQIVKRLMVSLLVGVLFSVLFNLQSLMKGDVPWQPHKSSSPAPPNPSPIWPPKR